MGRNVLEHRRTLNIGEGNVFNVDIAADGNIGNTAVLLWNFPGKRALLAFYFFAQLIFDDFHKSYLALIGFNIGIKNLKNSFRTGKRGNESVIA